MDEYKIEIYDQYNILSGYVYFEKHTKSLQYFIENDYYTTERYLFNRNANTGDDVPFFDNKMKEMFPNVKELELKLNIGNVIQKLINIGFIKQDIIRTVDPEDSTMTDWGRAQIFADEHINLVKYSHAMSSWYIWDGKRWKQDTNGTIYQCAKNTIKNMYGTVLPNIDDYDKKKTFLKQLVRSENQHALKAMLDSANNEPDIPVDVLDFDSQKGLINVENGVVDLKTGNLLPHEKHYLMTKMLDLEYSNEPQCEKWLNFLDETFEHDVDLIDFIKRFLGYALTGFTDEQIFCIFYGHGSNGKGTLIDTIMNVMGEYAKTTEPETIIKKKYERSSTNDLADLWGARFVTTSETESYQELDEGRIKRITGQDAIKCRFLYKDLFEYFPEYKLVLLTNHEPVIKSQDYSIWRRVLKIPFNVKRPKEEWNLNLRTELLEEREGIFRWLVDGAVAWHKDGLKVPKSVILATNEYKEELDIIGDFLDMCTMLGDTLTVRNIDIYKCYEQWCDGTNNKSFANTTFSRSLIERGFKNTKINGLRGKQGLDLKEDVKLLMKNDIFCKDMQKNPDCFLPQFDKSCSGNTTGDGGISENGQRDGRDGKTSLFGKSHSGEINNKKVPKKTVLPSQPSLLPINFQKKENYKYNEFENSSINVTIDMDYLAKVINSYRNTMFSNGVIQDIPHFALVVSNQSKELQEFYTVKQIEDAAQKIMLEYGESHGQRDKIQLIKDIIKKTDDYSEIISQAEILGIDSESVESIIKKLKQSGQIINTGDNGLKIIN